MILLNSLQGRLLLGARDEDDLRADLLMDCKSRVNAVQCAAQPDVHQHDLRSMLPSHGDGVLRGRGGPANLQSHVLQGHAPEVGDQYFVIDDKNAVLVIAHTSTGMGTRISVVIPIPSCTVIVPSSCSTRLLIMRVPRPDRTGSVRSEFA